MKIGRISAVVVDEIVARYYLAQNETNFIVLEEDFGDEEYGVGMRLEDTLLQEKLQEALDKGDVTRGEFGMAHETMQNLIESKIISLENMRITCGRLLKMFDR